MAPSVSLNTLIEFGLVIWSEGKLMAQWLSYSSYLSYFLPQYDTYDRYDGVGRIIFNNEMMSLKTILCKIIHDILPSLFLRCLR